MKHWESNALQQLMQDSDPQRVFGQAVRLAQELDMEFVGLSLHLHVAAHSPQVILYNNYPKEFNQRYQQDRFIRIDPIVSMCHQSTMPVLWCDEQFEEVPHLREAACQHGMRHGWSQSVHDLLHNESQLSVSRALHPIDTHELYAKSGQVMWLCHTLHAVLSEHHLASLTPPPQLSEREKEVLKWSAEGKTASDVATILSLSTSTVNFHLRNVISKFDACNKTRAIVKATRQGLV